jgi:hypothetical protein
MIRHSKGVEQLLLPAKRRLFPLVVLARAHTHTLTIWKNGARSHE